MVLPVENKSVFFGKTPDRFWIMGSRDELATGFEGFTKSRHKMTNFGQREMIVWLIPKTHQRSVSIVRRKNHRANHKALFAIRQVCERNRHVSLLVRELHLKTSRVFANHRILNVFEVWHHLLEIVIDLSVCSR